MSLLHSLKKIRGIKSEAMTLFRAFRDVRTPTTTKLIIAVLASAYIISPIDIAPDILPFLGITDDIMIIPLLMWVFIPNDILDDARKYVEDNTSRSKYHWKRNISIGILFLLVGYVIYNFLST